MTGRPPVDEDRDLDRWVQEVTDAWRVPGLEPRHAAWHERVSRPSSGRPRWPRRLGGLAAGVAGVALVGVVGLAVLFASIPRQPGPGSAPGTDAAGATDVPSSPAETLVATPALPSGPVETPALPPASDRPAPVDVARDELFELSISAGRATYAAQEPVEITAALRYVGDAPETTATSFGGGLVAFDIEQLDGPLDQGAGRDSICERHVYRRGDVEDVPFQKSGSWSNDDPMAPFWRDFFADPELRLPKGRYRISAVALYGVAECGDVRTLRASIVIVVQ